MNIEVFAFVTGLAMSIYGFCGLRFKSTAAKSFAAVMFIIGLNLAAYGFAGLLITMRGNYVGYQ